jgi:hypothetical protein
MTDVRELEQKRAAAEKTRLEWEAELETLKAREAEYKAKLEGFEVQDTKDVGAALGLLAEAQAGLAGVSALRAGIREKLKLAAAAVGEAERGIRAAHLAEIEPKQAKAKRAMLRALVGLRDALAVLLECDKEVTPYLGQATPWAKETAIQIGKLVERWQSVDRPGMMAAQGKL